VLAIIGAELLYFGPRLPERYRAAVFSESYACYSALFKQQAASLDALPLHHKDELPGRICLPLKSCRGIFPIP
jgi:hypothetical protein